MEFPLSPILALTRGCYPESEAITSHPPTHYLYLLFWYVALLGGIN